MQWRSQDCEIREGRGGAKSPLPTHYPPPFPPRNLQSLWERCKPSPLQNQVYGEICKLPQRGIWQNLSRQRLLNYITLPPFQTPLTPKATSGASTITCYTKYSPPRPSTQASYTASRVRPKRKISYAVARWCIINQYKPI